MSRRVFHNIQRLLIKYIFIISDYCYLSIYKQVTFFILSAFEIKIKFSLNSKHIEYAIPIALMTIAHLTDASSTRRPELVAEFCGGASGYSTGRHVYWLRTADSSRSRFSFRSRTAVFLPTGRISFDILKNRFPVKSPRTTRDADGRPRRTRLDACKRARGSVFFLLRQRSSNGRGEPRAFVFSSRSFEFYVRTDNARFVERLVTRRFLTVSIDRCFIPINPMPSLLIYVADNVI